MATYLVFEPQDGARTQANAERVVFLREKFSPWAFVFTPFWLLRYRLWLGFVVWLLAFALIALAGSSLGFGPYAAIAASFFPSLVFGFEAVNLRARRLVRNGYRDAGVVIAEDLDTAERRFFENWKNVPDKPVNYPTAPNAVPSASAEKNIIGMFPTPGQR